MNSGLDPYDAMTPSDLEMKRFTCPFCVLILALAGPAWGQSQERAEAIRRVQQYEQTIAPHVVQVEDAAGGIDLPESPRDSALDGKQFKP